MAAGDVMLDREVYRKSVVAGQGSRLPLGRRLSPRSPRGPAARRTVARPSPPKRVGPRGAVRELLSSADIAIVNHEGPAPNDASYHPSGLVFTFDPALLEGVANAGVDIVSLANNHIRNAGSMGVHGDHPQPAGRRASGSWGPAADPERARKPTCFDQGELRVCFLGYNAINTAVARGQRHARRSRGAGRRPTCGPTSAPLRREAPTSSPWCRIGDPST